MTDVDYVEHQKIVKALAAWVLSQEIGEKHAIAAMMDLSGILIGSVAKSEKDLDLRLHSSIQFFTGIAKRHFWKRQP